MAKHLKFLYEIMKNKLLLRIVLSPIVFLYSLFVITALTVFPISLVVCASFVGALISPFIWLFRKSGSNIEYYPDPAFNVTKYVFIDHLIGLTVHVWGAFYLVYEYIKKGKIFTGE